MTEKVIRAAFASVYPNDEAMVTLYENNRDFFLESIAGRHRWAAFRAGALAGVEATNSSPEVSHPSDQPDYTAKRVYDGMVDHCVHIRSIHASGFTLRPENPLQASSADPSQKQGQADLRFGTNEQRMKLLVESTTPREYRALKKSPENCGTGLCGCIEFLYATAKQTLTEQEIKEFLIDIYIANTESLWKTNSEMVEEITRLIGKRRGTDSERVEEGCGGWLEIKRPEDRQFIEGKSSVDGPVWTELYDRDEPIGKMRFWRPVSDLSNNTKEVDQCSIQKNP